MNVRETVVLIGVEMGGNLTPVMMMKEGMRIDGVGVEAYDYYCCNCCCCCCCMYGFDDNYRIGIGLVVFLVVRELITRLMDCLLVDRVERVD